MIISIESISIPERDSLVRTLKFSNMFFAQRKLLPVNVEIFEDYDAYALEADERYTRDHDILKAVLNGMPVDTSQSYDSQMNSLLHDVEND